MPPLSSYTPFESLLFFQSLAAHDYHRPVSFASISELLINNPFVRQDVTYDTSRLTPQALEELYSTLMVEELQSWDDKNDQTQTQAQNPKKRKVAAPPPLHDVSSLSVLLPALVSRLYARYKECVTKEIRHEEQRYIEIKDEITRLEAAPAQEQQLSPVVEQKPQLPQESVAATQPLTPTSAPLPAQLPPSLPQPPPSPLSKQVLSQQQQLPTPQRVAPKATQTPTGPGITADSGVPSQTPRNGFQQIHPKTDQTARKIQPAPAASKPPHTPILPYQQAAQIPNPSFLPVSSTPPVPAPNGAFMGAPPGTRPPQPHIPAAQGPRGQGQVLPPAWSPRPPVPSPGFQHAPPCPNVPYPNQQMPASPLYPAHPLPAGSTLTGSQPIPPVQSQEQKAKLLAEGPTAALPATPRGRTSAVETPLKAPDTLATPALSLAARRRSVSRTPWKIPDRITIPARASPEPPRPEDISPIDDWVPAPVPPSGRKIGRPRRGENAPAASRKAASPRRGRLSNRPTRRSTRSQSQAFSEASRDEESAADTTVTRGRIKREVPTTPIGYPEEGVPKTGVKRKRDFGDLALDEPPPSAGHAVQYVFCTRNFGRTCNPIMNDVAAHKYASIFAKPLTERDAPGYRSLIYRPQDIKSIKSAIHHGSKAVAAALEAGDDESAAAEAESEGVTPLKNNGIILKKTPELVPPKGIVQSSQLEKELIRMFANAVMFNPTPEQTFGPAFPMRTDSEPREGTQSSSEPEEGGIINDTLAMYDDVEKAVSTWRAAERAADDMGNKSLLSLRRGSASDINMDGAD